MTDVNLQFNEAIDLAKRRHEQLILMPVDYLRQQKHGLPVLNIGLMLSERLIEFAAPERPKYLAGCLTDLVHQTEGQALALSHIEVLFEPSLATDPLKLLKACSRQKTLLVEWPGYLSSTFLSYAMPSHPEYQEYREANLKDVIVLSAN